MKTLIAIMGRNGVGRWLALAAVLLLALGRLYGQREVIATSVAVPPSAPPTATLPAPAEGIQPASYTPEASPSPSNGLVKQALAISSPPAPAAPAAAPQPPSATPLLPPSALFGEKAAGAPASSPSATPANAQGMTLSVEVVMPERVLMGQPLTQEIVIRNSGTQPAAEVHVEEPLPAGARALHSEPSATPRDQRLTWDLHNLEPGSERRIKVELQPAADGALDLRPSVTFVSGNTPRTQVVRPPFSVELIANHESVPRNGQIVFSIRVANHGDAPVCHIKLYDQLPPGLHHPKGSTVVAGLGDLMPGETRTVTLETTALQTGKFRNEVSARADQGVEAKASLEVVITEPKLDLKVMGPKQTVSQRDVEFSLELVNPGPLAAKNVRLMQALPPTFEIASASTGANLDTEHHALVWSLPDLSAGQRQTVTFRGKASAAGDWPFAATVLTRNLAETRVAHTLHVESAAALHLEVHAQEERLAPNQETLYRIHLFNKGDAPCTGLRLTATLPDALTVLDAEGGPTAGQIEQHQVRFAPLEQLPAQAHTVYRLRVRGRQPGKGTLRVDLTADKQPAIQREMSIQVLGETTAASETTGRGNLAAGDNLR